jgi:hypothetical protein
MVGDVLVRIESECGREKGRQEGKVRSKEAVARARVSESGLFKVFE